MWWFIFRHCRVYIIEKDENIKKEGCKKVYLNPYFYEKTFTIQFA